MSQKLWRVVRSCVEMGDKNPIVQIHDQGAGGNCNVVKEIIYPLGAGGMPSALSCLLCHRSSSAYLLPHYCCVISADLLQSSTVSSSRAALAQGLPSSQPLCCPMCAEIDVRAVRVGDDTLSVLEIWGAEYQENDALLIKSESREAMQAICDRERCLMQVGRGFTLGPCMPSTSCSPCTTWMSIAWRLQ